MENHNFVGKTPCRSAIFIGHVTNYQRVPLFLSVGKNFNQITNIYEFRAGGIHRLPSADKQNHKSSHVGLQACPYAADRQSGIQI